MEKKVLNREEVVKIVEEARRDPQNIIRMIQKYGDRAVKSIHEGRLHLDFDDREGSSFNQDLLNLMPFEMRHPVCFTSWKGIIYVHSLDSATMDCNFMGTGKILAEVILNYGDVKIEK